MAGIVLAEATFYWTLAQLAVVLTVFVLSASLLGLAVEAWAEQAKAKKNEQREALDASLQEAQADLAQAQANPSAAGLRSHMKRVNNLTKELDRQDRAVASIDRRYRNAFSVRSGVVQPCILLAIALVSSACAWALTWDTATLYLGPTFWVTRATAGFLLLLLALGLNAYVAVRLGRSLHTVTDVAVESQRASLKSMETAVGLALKRHDEETSPVLELEIEQPQPIRAQVGKPFAVQTLVNLTNGTDAQNGLVNVLVPPLLTLDEARCPNWHRGDNPRGVDRWRDHAAWETHIPSVRPHLPAAGTIHFLPPATPGTYSLAFLLSCTGFSDTSARVEVLVEGQA